MFLALIIVAALWLAGMILVLAGLRRAPIVEEAQDGSIFVWENHRPKAREVSCVWPLTAMQHGQLR